MKNANSSIATRIREIRQRHGLSQMALAKRAGMVPAQLCKIESGRNDVTGTSLRRLAEALDTKVSVLLGEGSADEPERAVRAVRDAGSEGSLVPVLLSRMPEESVARIAETVAAFEKEMAEEEARLGIPSGVSVQLAYPYGIDDAAAALTARDMRFSLGLGSAPVQGLERTLELCGVRVLAVELAKDFPSMSFYDTSRHTLSIALNSRNTAERDVYRLAYEIGAATAFAKAAFATVRDEAATHRYIRGFAAAFLMPEEAVRRDVAQYGIAPDKWTLELLVMVKERYGVSAEAFALRLEKLGLVMPSVRAQLRERLHEYYAAHPNNMEPHSKKKKGQPVGRLEILKAAGGEVAVSSRLKAQSERIKNGTQTAEVIRKV